MNKIREYLLSRQDIKYRNFTLPLIPNVDENTFIGVRLPIIKRYAKELSEKDRFEGAFILMELLINDVRGEIADGAYRGNKEIVKVHVGGNIKRIGVSAFEGCSSLKEIIIEEGVEYVGEYAFKDCDALEILYIPKSLKKIEDSAFGVTFVPDGPCDMKEIGGDLAIKNIYYAGNRKEYYDDCCIEGIINVFEIIKDHRLTIHFGDGDSMYWKGPNEPMTESPDGLPF